MRSPLALVLGALVGGLIAAGCRMPTEAMPLPPDAVAITPPPEYERWWRDTQDCSAIRGELHTVHWYVVPNVTTVRSDDGDAAGFWSPRGDVIVLAGWYQDSPWVVRHEMLHALLQVHGHPPEFFRARCGDLVG